MHRRGEAVAAGLILTLGAACTSPPKAGPAGVPSPSASSPSAATPSATPSTPEEEPAEPNEQVDPPDPVSLPALAERGFDGGGLRISGILDMPSGRGPFPALVLAHGYIDPAIYVNGQA